MTYRSEFSHQRAFFIQYIEASLVVEQLYYLTALRHEDKDIMRIIGILPHSTPDNFTQTEDTFPHINVSVKEVIIICKYVIKIKRHV